LKGIEMADEPLYYPIASQNPLHPATELSAIQSECPVSRVRIWNGMEPWLITGYDNVRAILTHPGVSAVDRDPAYPHTSLAAQYTRTEFPTFLQMDAPEHTFYRLMVAGEFSVARSQSRRAEILEMVDRAIDDLLHLEPPVNFIEEFALVVPSTMIAMLLGVPQTDHSFFQTRSHTLTSGRSTEEDVRIATQEMREYLEELVAAKEKDPQDDLLSRLVVNHERKGEISHDQLVATARMLLTGGHDTTASMIGLGTMVLLLNPGELEQLNVDRSLMQNAVEEMLRFFTITHIGRRRVLKEDITLAGVTMHAGEGIVADHKIANRDPRVFPDPNAFDIDRDTKRHLAFGTGPHQCLGQQLARVELQVVFDRLLTRIPTLHLIGGPESIVWKDPETVTTGLEELMVAW
jgi:cytochrome P450